MSSRTLLNGLLLVLAVSLLLVAYFQPGLEKARPLPKLTSLDTAAVKSITLLYPEGKRVVLERRKGRWYLVEPLEAEANRFRAESLLFLTQEGVIASYAPSAIDLAKVKLDKPLLRVRFDGVEVAFGDTEPLEGNRYALAGGKVVLIRDRIAPLLHADVTYFVSLALLPEGARIASIKLPLLKDKPEPQSPFAGEVELRREGGAWKLIPPDAEVTQEAIERLVDGWRYAHALEVKALQGDEQPIAEVTLRLEGEKEPLRFEVLAAGPEPWLARPDLRLRYHLTEELFKRLFRFEKKAKPGDAGAP